MKRAVAVAALTVGLVGASPARAQSVTYLEAQKVAEAFAKGGALVIASDLSVTAGHREGPGQVELHDKETDVFYVVDGDATFVTGGTIIGSRQTAPGQTRGTGIEGGEARHLKKGDIIVIPAGTPHWFREVSPMINYLTVKVIKP